MFSILIIAMSILTGAQSSGPLPAKYVFYLHGKIVEDQGLEAYSEQFGKYEYKAIIQALRENNVQVISEVRPKNTPIVFYAQKVAGQIRELLNEGVKASDITVIGASKGALIAMQVSTLLKNKELNFVLIAGHIESIQQHFKFNLHGNILGFYEKTDQIAGTSYQVLIDKSTGVNRFKEIELNTKLGHGIVFRPLKEWLHPTKAWMD